MSRIACRLLALTLGLIPAPGCEQPPTVLPGDCGDGVVDPGEECDRDDLGGQTCDALLPGTTGTLLCSAECTYFVGRCQAVGSCGDGRRDPGEECDDGNLASGDGCSTSCTVEFRPGCGNGVLDPGEACDDGNHWAGDGCSSQCLLEGSEPCGELTLCASGCVDVSTDPDHCGACGPLCAPGTPCVAGVCLRPEAEWRLWEPVPTDAHDVFARWYDSGLGDWIPAGAGPVNPVGGAITPSILVLGPFAWVAYVDVSGAVGQVRVTRYDPLADTWVEVGGALNLDPAIAAHAPLLAGSLGEPWVAFLEDGVLHVKGLD